MNTAYESRVLELLSSRNYVPLTPDAIAAELEIPKKKVPAFRRELDEMQRRGTVVRLKKDRLCVPKDADLVTGKMRFKQSGAALLFPESDDGKRGEPLQIRAEDTWVSFHGDRVVARLVEERSKGGDNRRGKRRAPAKKAPGEQRFARVIRILDRARETFTGTLQKSRLFYYVIPDDPRIIQDILVPDPKFAETKDRPAINDKVVVRLLEWKQRHLNPQGEIIEVLGETHHPLTEYKALLHQYGLNPEFPSEVVTEVKNIPPRVSDKQRQGRLDLRGVFTFTIDPDDAKDFDDALSVEKLEDGNFRIGVHIADVSAYVKPGTAIDLEAQNRGNSTYLVGTVIPMLPHALSNGVCSLVEAEDRLTKTVFVDFSPRGKIIKTHFANSVICSDKRLTYFQAHALLKEDDFNKIRKMPLPAAHQTGSTGRALSEMSNKELARLQGAVRQLWTFASKMRERRMRNGSLDFDMPEIKILVDENGRADKIISIEYDESHQLIEEYMLTANEVVDKTLMDANFALLHRVHDKPEPDKLDELRDFLGTHGIETGDLTNRREVTAMLKKIKGHPQAHTLRVQFLRSLKQACYRAEADGHYGLNKQFYTHFTSPIRRYSDLIVHRIFDHFLVKRGDPTAPANPPQIYKPGKLRSLAQHVSLTEQNSTEAERDSQKIKLIEFFENELAKDEKTAFEASVMDIRNHGMFVELTESQAYGLVHISTLRDDMYRVSPDGTRLTGKRKRRKFVVGQKIEVVVERIDRFKRQIDFRLAESGDDEKREKRKGRNNRKSP